MDQTSYLEGTNGSHASTPRSYIIEAQGCRYRCNRQHIRPINSDSLSPFSRPYIHTRPQSHNTSIISQTQSISGPPQPLSEPKVVWNSKMPTLSDTPHWPSNKLCKTTHHNCPYTRPHSTKPWKPPHNPIPGPPPQAELCPNKLPMHLISINGIPQPSAKNNPGPSNSPLSPSPSSLLSSVRSPDSNSGSSSSITESSSETESTASTMSTASDRQLCPHLPIRYNEVFLKKLSGRPQITTMNNLSIPLPPSDTDEEEDMDTT